MDEFLIMFINEYGTAILYSILTVAATALGAWVGRIYKTHVDDETKRKVVLTCCKAVEQLYKDVDGEERFALACQAIEEMLAEKGITITDLELKMLIEEVCLDFAHSVKTEVDKPAELAEAAYGG